MKSQVIKIAAYSICCLVSVATCFPAKGATFTSESDWQSAAGNYQLETFESIGTLGTEVTSLPSLGLEFSTTNHIYNGTSGGPLFGNFSLINTFPFNPNDLDGFSITASNGNLITALGAWNASGDDELFITFYNELDVVMESVFISASQTQSSFGGIVNSQGASRVEITATGNANRWIAIDNLQVSLQSSTRSVPEPSSLLSLCLGLVGILGLHKKSGN
ncbi:MAG: PEP-CTERM sorting domain-containing protein [Sphaerospermopsis sp. SIO1G2]|nr:PEP-CTERM sorting domain-containing protein [Sphaerospermopsis sp. SIO1G2]